MDLRFHHSSPKQKPDYHLNKATVIRSLGSGFGNPAVPEGPVAFRPTIARGLALSVSRFLLRASMMPALSEIYNSLKNRIFLRLLLD